MLKPNNNNSSSQKHSILSTLIYWLTSLNAVKLIFITYFIITLIGSLILWAPISQKSGVDVSYIDSLFTAASAFSDTGLVTSVTSETWSYFGQGIIALLILIGGIGFFALKVYLFNIILFNRSLSLSGREALSAERGSVKIGATRELIKYSVTALLSLIIVFSIGLTFYFYFTEVDFSWAVDAGLVDSEEYMTEIPYKNLATSFRFGFFHTVSAINNAGFDIMGQNSLLGYYHDVPLQIIFIVLFVIGGLGFPVIFDSIKWAKSVFTGKRFSFSLFTKLSFTTYVIVALAGLGIAFALETTAKDIAGESTFWHDDRYGSQGMKSLAIVFNTMSTRNAGFATIDLQSLSNGTIFLYIMLMFIGSSPSSTAGGIRTTTIAIVILSIWKQIRGREKVRVFNRRITNTTTSRSFVVFTTAIIIVLIGTVVGITSFPTHGGTIPSDTPFLYMMFEVASAFGTTGLSMGITSDLSIATKITLIFIMFIGQLGVSSSLLIWSGRKGKSTLYSYIEEDITIG